MKDVINKVVSSIAPVLVQSAIVLAIVALVLTDYVDKRAVQLKQYVDQNQMKIKTISLGMIVNKMTEDGLSTDDISDYTDSLFDHFDAQGIVVIDSESVLTGPSIIYDEIPSYEELKK